MQTETLLSLSERRARRAKPAVVTSAADLAQYEDATAYPFDVKV